MFDSLWNLMGTMFFMIVIGCILRKIKVIDDAGRKCLTEIILKVILPCNIINAFSKPLPDSFNKLSVVLIMGLIINIGYILLAKFLFNTMPNNEKPCYQYSTVCPNAGFIGNPLVEGVFGIDGLTYASIFMLPGRVTMWTAGVSYFNEHKNRKQAYKKVFLSPCMVATYIGMIILFANIVLPQVIASTVSSFSRCTTAFTMMYVGSVLADVEFKKLISKRLLAFCMLRLVLIPLAIYIICVISKFEPLVTGICTILPATPAGSTTSLLATKYNADQKTATKLVVLTTLFSIITIPIWSMILLQKF